MGAGSALLGAASFLWAIAQRPQLLPA